MSIINRTAVRKYALEVAEKERKASGFRIVSKDFIEAVEASVRSAVIDRIRRHPSKGVTLK